MTGLRSFKAIFVNPFLYKVWLVNNNIKAMGPLIGHENLYLSIIVHDYEVIIIFAQVLRCVSMRPYRFCTYNEA
jgi:hypothetical protein